MTKLLRQFWETVKADNWYFAAVALGIIIIFAVYHRQFFKTFHFPQPEKISYIDDLQDRGQKLLRDARVTGSYRFSPDGLVLDRGEKVSIQYHFSRKHLEQKVILRLWFFKNPYVANKLEIVKEDGARQVITNQHFQGSPSLDLTQILQGQKEFDLVLTAALSDEAPMSQSLVFDKIALDIISDFPLPPLPSVLYLLTAYILIFTILNRPKTTQPYAIPLSLGVLFLLMIKFWAYEDGLVSNYLIAFFGLAGLWFMRIKFPQLFNASRVINLTLLFLLVLALDYRWPLLEATKTTPLEPDGVVYISIAQSSRGLWDTDFREPVIIWAIKIFFWLFGSAELNLRLMTILMSLATIWLTYFFCLRILGSPLIGLIAAFLLAASKGFIYQNVRGLRLELYILTILPFLLLLLRSNNLKQPVKAGLIGIWGGLNILNNLAAIGFVMFLLAYFSLRNRWKWQLLPLAIFVSLIMAVPHLVHNKKQFGDYFYSTNIHAQYYRNQEFKGQPGFPSVEEVAKNGYCGPATTTLKYMFGMHSLGEVINRSWAGLKRIYLGPDTQQFVLDGNKMPYYFYILGLLILLFRRPDLLVCLILLNISSYFLAGTETIFFDRRLTMHMAPLVCLATALGIEGLVRLFPSKSNAQSPRVGAKKPATVEKKT